MMDRSHRDFLDYLMLTTYQKRAQAGEIWTEGVLEPSTILEDEVGVRRILRSAAHGPEGRPRISTRQTLTPLPSDLPDSLAPFEAALTGPEAWTGEPIERLALLLRYAAAPLRWEPLNSYHPHYGVASPRSLTLCDIRILAYGPGDGDTTAYRYLPEHQALARTGTLASRLGSRSGLGVFIVGHLSRCAAPYGEFSACLAPLEAGALAAQISLLAHALGWREPTMPRPVQPDLREALGLTHWSQNVVCQLDIDGVDLKSELAALPAREDSISERALDQTVEQYPFMRAFVAGAGAVRLGATPASSAPRRPGPSPDGRPDDLLHILRSRSSGRENDGSPSRAARLDRDALMALIADWRFLMSRGFLGDLAALPVSIAIAVLNGQPDVIGRYRLNPDAADLDFLGGLDPDQLASFHNRFHWEGLTLVATVSIDPWIAMESFPDAPFAALHAAAGACGHFLALSAARRGAFARPVRSYTEDALSGVTPLNEVVVLQLVCGFSRQPNLGLDLI